MSELKLWPWDNDEDPYWINPENGIHWYIDKSLTDWCNNGRASSLPPLNAIGFILAQEVNDKMEAITRIILDKKTNNILVDEKGLEGMAIKIDMLRLIKQSEKQEEE